MSSFIKYSAVFLILLIAATCLQKKAAAQLELSNTYKGKITIIYENLPRFEDFPAEVTSGVINNNIVWDSYIDALQFKDAFEAALALGPNIAGIYRLVSIGCGTACQQNFFINTVTGKIIRAPNTSFGLMGKVDSRLFITDPPESPEAVNPENYYQYKTQIRFFEISQDKIKLRRTIYINDPSLVINFSR